MTDPAEELRPRTTGYWLGGAIVGLGVVAAAVLFAVTLSRAIGAFHDLRDDVDALDRFPVPGEAVLTFDEPGDRVVYAEGPVSPIGRLGTGAVTVESTAGDSTPLPLRSVGVDEAYDVGGHTGRAALRFTVDEPGAYRVTVGDVPGSVTGVAVGPRLDVVGPVASVFVVIILPFGVGVTLVVAGAAVLIVTGVGRSGARRRARMAAAPPVPGWGAPPGPGGSPPVGPGPSPAFGGGAPVPPGGGLPPGLPPSAYPPPGWPAAPWSTAPGPAPGPAWPPPGGVEDAPGGAAPSGPAG